MKDRYWIIIAIVFSILVIPLWINGVFADSTGFFTDSSYYMADGGSTGIIGTNCVSTGLSMVGGFWDLYKPSSTIQDGCFISVGHWSLNNIPSNVHITSVELKLNSKNINNPINCNYGKLTHDPSYANPDLSGIWNDALTETVYVSNDSACTIQGSHIINLGSNAVTDLQNSLTTGSFNLWMKYSNFIRDSTYHQQLAQNISQSDLQLRINYTIGNINYQESLTDIIKTTDSLSIKKPIITNSSTSYIVINTGTSTQLKNATGYILYNQSKGNDDSIVIQKAINLSLSDRDNENYLNYHQSIADKKIEIFGDMNLKTSITINASGITLNSYGNLNINSPISINAIKLGDGGNTLIGSHIYINHISNEGNTKSNATEIIEVKSSEIIINKATNFNAVFYDHNRVGHWQQYHGIFKILESENNVYGFYHDQSDTSDNDFFSGSEFTLDGYSATAVYIAKGSNGGGSTYYGFINDPDYQSGAIQDYGGGGNRFCFSYITESKSHFSDLDTINCHNEINDGNGDIIPDVPILQSNILHQNAQPFTVFYSIAISGGTGIAFVESQYNQSSSLIQVSSGSNLYFMVQPYHSYKIILNDGIIQTTSIQRLYE